MRSGWVALFLLWNVLAAAAPPSPGLYFDRDRDGHGLDLQIVGDRVVGTFFSFADDGQPVWYLIDGSWSGDSGNLAISEYRYDPGANPAATVFARFPGASLTRVSDSNACGSGGARPVPPASTTSASPSAARHCAGVWNRSYRPPRRPNRRCPAAGLAATTTAGGA